MTLQSREERGSAERGSAERGIEILRCGAKRLMSTFVDKEQRRLMRVLLFVREGGRSAPASHSVELQFHALTRTALALFVLLTLGFSLPSHAQNAPTLVPTITGPPKVLILVYQQPGGADQVSITYDPKVPLAQAAADIDALTQATGWPISSRSITEAPSPLTNRPGAMTSVTFAVPGAVQDSSHTFPIEALARVFQRYKRLNAVFIVGPQFQFQGARSYADNDIRVVLDQHETSYVYQIEVLGQFSHLPLAPGTGNAAVHKPTWILLLGIIGAAALAGIVVYFLTARLPQTQPKQDDTDAEAETRLEAGTRK